jgi:DNA (cytosine-5)-methyltransferase 1
MEGGRQILECQISEVENERPSWESHWIEVASTLCNVAYGLPKELVRPDGSRDRNYSWWRTQALKAGGNAIVPQIAIEIFKSILQAENKYGHYLKK